jgi:hypothetical protein
MKLSEVRAIAKSVPKWKWRHFSECKFSERQAQRAAIRAAQMWADHVSADATKPWQAMGIGRATYYSRRKPANRTAKL